MVWYKHWLEIRARAVLGLVFLVSITFITLHVQNPGRSPFTRSVAATLGAEVFEVWAPYAFLIAMLVTILAFVSQSTGIVSYSVMGHTHRSTYYSLSLPVSRANLIRTRFLVTYAQIIVTIALAFSMACLWIQTLGRAIPLGPMLMASLIAALLALPVVALAGLWSFLLGCNWGSLAATACCFALAPLVRLFALDGFVERRIPWTPGLIALALTAAVLGATIRIANRKEY